MTTERWRIPPPQPEPPPPELPPEWEDIRKAQTPTGIISPQDLPDWLKQWNEYAQAWGASITSPFRPGLAKYHAPLSPYFLPGGEGAEEYERWHAPWGVKGLAELTFPAELPIWFTGMGAGRTAIQAALKRAQKPLAKMAAGEALKAGEKKSIAKLHLAEQAAERKVMPSATEVLQSQSTALVKWEPASYQQLLQIHDVARTRGLWNRVKGTPNKDYYRVLKTWFGKTHSNELSPFEADTFIRALSEVKVRAGKVILPKGKALITEGLQNDIKAFKEIRVIDRTRQAPYIFEKMGDDAANLWWDTQWADIRKMEKAIELEGYLQNFRKALGKDWKLSDARVFRALQNPLESLNLSEAEQNLYLFARQFYDSAALTLKLTPKQMRQNYITHTFDRAIRQSYKAKMGISQDLAYALDVNLPKEFAMPYLKQRYGATLGLQESVFKSMRAYGRYLYRNQELQPMLDRFNALIKFLPSEQEWAPTRNYLQNFAQRLTNRPTVLDLEVTNQLKAIGNAFRKLGKPGEKVADHLLQGTNLGQKVAYNYAGIYYLAWIGFKPLSAIRNLSQQLLAVAHTGPLDFARGLGLSKAEVAALKENTAMWRSRALQQFLGGLEEEFAQWIPRKITRAGMWLFQRADYANVINSLKAGYAQAKRLGLPNEWAYKYADEVAMQTQYFYTKMARSMLEQNTVGRFFTPFTTWPRNFFELMAGWTKGRQSYVLQRYMKDITAKGLTNEKAAQHLSQQGILARRKQLLRFMAILGAAYTVKETTDIRATEYVGWTSVGQMARIFQGEIPSLTLLRGIGEIVYGVSQNDMPVAKRGLNRVRPDRFIGIIRQFEDIASGEIDWLSLFIYLNRNTQSQVEKKGQMPLPSRVPFPR